jgi:hypothetical protein
MYDIATGLCQLDTQQVEMQYQTADPVFVVGQLGEIAGLLSGLCT